MSEQDGTTSTHTALMAAAAAGIGGLSPPTSSDTVPSATPSSLGQTSSGSQRLGALESIAGELYGLSTPIFPPTTLDLPDISFSNSVNNGNDGGGIFGHDHHGLFGDGTGGQLMGDLTISSHNGHHQHQQQHSSHHQQQLQIQQSLQQIQERQQQHQGGQFPLSGCSPHGTSSSDDSDDLPLAQLAKRQPFPHTTTSTASSNTSVSEGRTESQGNSPINTTASTVTTSSASAIGSTAAKKAKVSKRKKKKDPNEPQKPVSAYALFFRDTQATIKGHNPSASFGEVSKIVASMWDQLDPEHKDVYKKKTETAKKQYLKQLAAYRASQVSQSASDETEKSPSPPAGVAVSPPQTMGGHMPLSPSQQPIGSTGFAGPIVSPPHMGTPIDEQQQQIHQHQVQQQQMMQMSPQHQMMQQQQHHMMQHQMQQQMQQMQQQQQQQQQQMMGMGNQPPGMTSPPQQQPQLHTSPPHHDPSKMYGDFTETPREMDLGYPHCVRSGCTNQARENPAWDSQYCSNDCVITHCRDIFTTWVGSRPASNSFPVK